MSSAAEGWYVDPSTGTNLRYWDGSTWTDEVAPLPYEPTHSGPVDLLASAAASDRTGRAASQGEAEPPEKHPEPILALEPEVERTRLSRRELRARREKDAVDDAPRHLPPSQPLAAVSVADWTPTAEHDDVEEIVVVPPADDSTEEPQADPERRRRVLRLTVLLGLLAMVTSFAVLTAGSL